MYWVINPIPIGMPIVEFVLSLTGQVRSSKEMFSCAAVEQSMKFLPESISAESTMVCTSKCFIMACNINGGTGKNASLLTTEVSG